MLPQQNCRDHQSVVQSLQDAQQAGRMHPGRKRQLADYRLQHMALSRYVNVVPSQLGGIRWMDLDPVEQRYLITAAADTTIEAFDVMSADDGGGHQPVDLRPLFTVARGAAGAHRYQVTCVAWYPIDTGLFVTGSADQEVKVWDTNTTQVACSFSCSDKVVTLAMSPVASSHALIAVGDKQQGLVLADIASGAFTHTLNGHRDGAWCICWDPGNQYQLFSGDGTGAVRLWDIRRSGCRALLDINCTHRPRRTAGATRRRRDDAGPGHKRARVRDSTGAEAPWEGSTLGDGGSGGGVMRALEAAGGVNAVAHEGAVTGLLATPDGRHLVSAGHDHRVRLWDSGYLHHQLVHYSHTLNKGHFPKRIACTADGRVLFCPRGQDIQVFDIITGHEIVRLSQGHYDTITAVTFSPLTGHLWSTGLDGAVLAWSLGPQQNPEPQAAAPHYMDSWLAAAAAGRGRQHWGGQESNSSGFSGTAAALPPPSITGRGAPARHALPDVDFWSDDEETLIGGRETT